MLWAELHSLSLPRSFPATAEWPFVFIYVPHLLGFPSGVDHRDCHFKDGWLCIGFSNDVWHGILLECVIDCREKWQEAASFCMVLRRSRLWDRAVPRPIENAGVLALMPGFSLEPSFNKIHQPPQYLPSRAPTLALDCGLLNLNLDKICICLLSCVKTVSSASPYPKGIHWQLWNAQSCVTILWPFLHPGLLTGSPLAV